MLTGRKPGTRIQRALVLAGSLGLSVPADEFWDRWGSFKGAEKRGSKGSLWFRSLETCKITMTQSRGCCKPAMKLLLIAGGDEVREALKKRKKSMADVEARPLEHLNLFVLS